MNGVNGDGPDGGLNEVEGDGPNGKSGNGTDGGLKEVGNDGSPVVLIRGSEP